MAWWRLCFKDHQRPESRKSGVALRQRRTNHQSGRRYATRKARISRKSLGNDRVFNLIHMGQD
jgi:hypothetical protein